MPVKIRIDKNGDLHVEVNGVEGSSCEDLTNALIQSVGEIEEKTYTEEYHQERPDFLETHEE